jgi:hypothetical protein
MITGFNPADMYGVGPHPPRAAAIYPGVFSGIGEFTIHKEFVSSKVAGNPPASPNPALDRILDFRRRIGPAGADPHSDLDMPFAKPDAEPGLPHADEGAAARALRRRRSSGRHRGWAASCTRSRAVAGGRRRA